MTLLSLFCFLLSLFRTDFFIDCLACAAALRAVTAAHAAFRRAWPLSQRGGNVAIDNDDENEVYAGYPLTMKGEPKRLKLLQGQHTCELGESAAFRMQTFWRGPMSRPLPANSCVSLTLVVGIAVPADPFAAWYCELNLYGWLPLFGPLKAAWGAQLLVAGRLMARGAAARRKQRITADQ